jgi:hypothetical protein
VRPKIDCPYVVSRQAKQNIIVTTIAYVKSVVREEDCRTACARHSVTNSSAEEPFLKYSHVSNIVQAYTPAIAAAAAAAAGRIFVVHVLHVGILRKTIDNSQGSLPSVFLATASTTWSIKCVCFIPSLSREDFSSARENDFIFISDLFEYVAWHIANRVCD